MSHLTPWLLRIGAEVAGTILANHKAGRRPRDSQIDDALLVSCRLDMVAVACGTQVHGHFVRAGAELVGAELEVFKGIGGPKVGICAVDMVEDLGVELCRGSYAAVER